MSTIDYTQVSRDDLEMLREPRKSQFTVRHKPTGVVAQSPVIPGSLSPARFRRPSNLPKENKVEGMEGYIEGRNESDTALYVITTGEKARNEYLDALASDPVALKACFEGISKEAPTQAQVPGESSPAPPSPPAAETTPAEQPSSTSGEELVEQPSDVSAPAEAAAADDTPIEGVEDELDDLLSKLEVE